MVGIGAVAVTVVESITWASVTRRMAEVVGTSEATTARLKAIAAIAVFSSSSVSFATEEAEAVAW